MGIDIGSGPPTLSKHMAGDPRRAINSKILILDMERSADGDTDRSAWNAIPFSIQQWDFATHTSLGANSADTSRHWLSIGIDQHKWQSDDERQEILILRFNGIERSAWADYLEARRSVPPPKFDFLPPPKMMMKTPPREDVDISEPAVSFVLSTRPSGYRSIAADS